MSGLRLQLPSGLRSGDPEAETRTANAPAESDESSEVFESWMACWASATTG